MPGTPLVVDGAHAILYSTDADADRRFFRNVLGLPHVDVGRGWLIFGLPPSELAVHPGGAEARHELYLMCPDLDAFVERMTAHGVACDAPAEQPWGVLTSLTLPGGGRLGVYEPRHPRPAAAPVATLDRDAAVACYTGLLEAWNARDAGRFAACFEADATVIGFDGSLMEGREEIAREIGRVFASHRTARYVALVRDVRAAPGGAALLRADVGMVPPDASALNPDVNARQTAVVGGSPSAPRIAWFQNTPAALHGRPDAAAALTDELTAACRRQQVVSD
jgi:uncharacterized protein (TIGR02246 family)